MIHNLQTIMDNSYQMADLGFRTNKLKLNGEKSKTFFFTFRGKNNIFLVFTLDQKLTWKYHM